MIDITYEFLEQNGRLGNQLWQIAWQFGEAKRLNGTPKIKSDWRYRQYFSIPDEFFSSSDKINFIDGGTNYFQELHYFDNVSQLIKQYFQPNINYDFPLLDKSNDYCSVHVRRGDYLNHPKLFPQCTSKYYTDAVNDVLSRNEDIIFIIFSDDINWCKKSISYLGLTDRNIIFVDPIVTPVDISMRSNNPKDQIDLFSMIQCNEHILSNSTFSWWGAWLSSNINPIYPSEWFGPDVPGYDTHKLAFNKNWREFKC